MESIQEIALNYEGVDSSKCHHVYDFGAALNCVLLQEKQGNHCWPGESQASLLWRGYFHQD